MFLNLYSLSAALPTILRMVNGCRDTKSESEKNRDVSRK